MESGSLKDVLQQAAEEYEQLRREEKLDKAGDHMWQQVVSWL